MHTAEAILAYTHESHHIDLRAFVETAYFRAYGKPIPPGTLMSEVRHVTDAARWSQETDGRGISTVIGAVGDQYLASAPLPNFLAQFLIYVQSS